MRRGLIHWSLEELPAAALEARVARLQAGMRAAGLGAVLVYSSFAQPAPLQWLCNYVPYWSEALLVVWPEGAPTMLVAGTPRTHSWIRSVSHMGELVAAPKPGAQAAELLGKVLPAGARVGVIALDAGLHAFEVDYFERTGSAGLVVSWQGPDGVKQVIPSSRFFRGGTNNPADLTNDGTVDAQDVAILLANWGPCSN